MCARHCAHARARACVPTHATWPFIAQQSTIQVLRRAASITNLNTQGCCRHFDIADSCRCCVRIFAKHSASWVVSARFRFGLLNADEEKCEQTSKVRSQDTSQRAFAKPDHLSFFFFNIFCRAYGGYAAGRLIPQDYVVMDYLRTNTFTRFHSKAAQGKSADSRWSEVRPWPCGPSHSHGKCGQVQVRVSLEIPSVQLASQRLAIRLNRTCH